MVRDSACTLMSGGIVGYISFLHIIPTATRGSRDRPLIDSDFFRTRGGAATTNDDKRFVDRWARRRERMLGRVSPACV
jgi:hypothetical protein